MSIPNLQQFSVLRAQLRAVKLNMGKPYNFMPKRTALAAMLKHGGVPTLLDQDLMTARLAAMSAAQPEDPNDESALEKKMLTVDAAGKLRALAQNFFYKLIDKDGYLIHSELMAYISEPGAGNGVAFDSGAEASPTIPAVFTFVGQFIDHDLTLNGMNLTENEDGVVVQDKASPIIDLDSVYGLLFKDAVPDPRNPERVEGFKKVFEKIFDENGKFRLNPVGDNFDLCREDDGMGHSQAIIFDPRNDENQLILQIHILVERFHNALIDSGLLENLPDDPIERVEFVRREVVATWQHFVLTDYMREIIRPEVLDYVIEQIDLKAPDVDHLEEQYGKLKHKPYKDLVTGKNVVRMPHEFAIGFRFGHSQLRPFYILNKDSIVILFKDARQSQEIMLQVPSPYNKISGKDDLRGSRPLSPDHVIDWDIFYPEIRADATQSLKIDHKVTERVFNLPETAIPDDIKYIGNLAHRNLIRSSQIGIVSGEELAEFYGYTGGDVLTPEEVLNNAVNPGDIDDSKNKAVTDLFRLDPKPEERDLPMEERQFRTPLWYYIIREGEIHSKNFCVPVNDDSSECRNQLGKVGSRLVAEVLVGGLYYGDDFRFDNKWVSVLHQQEGETPNPQNFGNIVVADSFTFREIIEFVRNTTIKQSGCKKD